MDMPMDQEPTGAMGRRFNGRSRASCWEGNVSLTKRLRTSQYSGLFNLFVDTFSNKKNETKRTTQHNTCLIVVRLWSDRGRTVAEQSFLMFFKHSHKYSRPTVVLQWSTVVLPWLGRGWAVVGPWSDRGRGVAGACFCISFSCVFCCTEVLPCSDRGRTVVGPWSDRGRTVVGPWFDSGRTVAGVFLL